jgi:hypothetical protein
MAKTETTDFSFLPNRSFCFPSLVYFFMGIIGSVASIGELSILSLLVKLIFVFAWTWFLNLLCERGYSGISWFLVFLPFILFVLMFFVALEVASWSGKGFSYNEFNGAPTPGPFNNASLVTTMKR